jgi:L-malate glycosyltransferase
VRLAQLDGVSRRLNVAVVAPTLGILGGQAVQADRLLRAWKGDHDVHAWLVPVNPNPPGPFRWLAKIKFVRTVVTQLVYWPQLVRELRRADVVHVFSASYLSFLLAPLPAVLIARLLGKPVVMNYRSGEAPDHLKRSALARATLRRVQTNAVPSEFLQDVFARFGIRARVIPNIVDLERFAFHMRTPLRPKLLCTRNLEPLYNVDCTLRAFEIVQRMYPDATLTVVGKGSQASALRRLATERGLREVHFVGPVHPSQIWRYYADADIYLQTPDIDNMPSSVIEAFASGCAVVSTDAGGVSTILTDGVHGQLVPCGDYAAAAERVVRLLRDPAFAERTIVEGRRSCERYTWNAVRELWLSMYRGLLKPESTPRTNALASPRVRPASSSTEQSPVNVAMVAPTLRILGGHAVQAVRLLEAWERERAVRAWLVPINPVPPPPLRWLTRLKYARTGVTQLTYWPLLVRELRHADVVHVFSASYLSFLLAPLPAVLVARMLGKPIVMNYRSGEACDHLQHSRIARATLRNVNANVVPSGFLKNVFARFGIDSEVIPDIVDLEKFAFRPRRPSGRAILSTRNFEPLYDVACTIKAFAIVQRKYPDATLTLVGGGTQTAALRALAAQLGVRNVHFAGRVPPSDIWQYYAAADIYLQTPEIDNMPASVVEAFASGCVVVSTAAGGLPEIITDGVHGCLVPCGDCAAAARRVMDVIEDPEMAARLARQARERCEYYQWEAVRNLWMTVYRTTLDGVAGDAAHASV